MNKIESIEDAIRAVYHVRSILVGVAGLASLRNEQAKVDVFENAKELAAEGVVRSDRLFDFLLSELVRLQSEG